MKSTERERALLTRLNPLKGTAIFFITSALWILLSDQVVLWITRDPEAVSRAQSVKGLAYVLLMSVLVYTLIRREIAAVHYADQRIIASELRHRQMFEHNRSIQLIINPNTAEIVDANPAAADYYGYPLDVLRTMRITQINTLPEASVRAELDNARREQLNYFTFRHRLASGEIRDVEVVSNPIQLEGQTYLYSIIHDISDRRRAESALQDRERRFRAIFDQSFQFICLLDPAGTILEANQTGLEFGSLNPEDAVCRPLWEIRWWDAPTSQRLRQGIAEAASGRFVRFEVEMHGSGGAAVMVDFSLKPIRDEVGAVTLLIVEGRDINDLRRAVTALREANQTLEALVAASPVPIISLDRGGYVKMWNPAAERVFGWSSGETLGRSFPLTREQDRAAFEAMFEAMLGGQTFGGIEATYPHKDGSLIEVSVSSGPLRDARGRVSGVMLLAADITDQKRAAGALAQSEAELRALFEAMTDVILVLDSEGHYLKVAPTGQTLLVQPAQNLLGRSLYEFFPPAQAAQFHDFVQLALKTGQPVKTEYSLSIDGALTWFAATISPMLADQVVWVARDITEQRRADTLQSALYRIAEITGAAEDMPSFFAAVHRIVGELMYAHNLYIALYDPAADLLSYPYWIDETEPAPKPEHPKRGLTGTVLRAGQPLLISEEGRQAMAARGELELLGTPTVDWLGVPLKRGDETFGVLAVQSYDPSVRFSEKDLELLTFVSQHIATALERQQAAEALRQSEERYRTLIETSPDAVTYTDINANIILANQQLASILGVESSDKLVGRSAFEFVAPEERERAFENARRTLATGAVRGLEYTMVRADGVRVPVELSASLLTGEDGAPRGFVGVTRDITERNRVEAALRRRDAILSALAYASERLLLEDPMAILPDILELLGETMGVSRAYVYQNHLSPDGRLLATQRFEWAAPGIESQIDNPAVSNLDYVAQGLEPFVESLGAGQPVFGLVSQLPEPERQVLEAENTRSILVVPIFSEGRWWGFLGLDECLRDWEWQAAEIEALRSAAGALGAAFARRAIEVAEREQRTLAEALRDSAAALSSTLNLDEVFESILSNLDHVVPHDAANIMLIENGAARIIRRHGRAEPGWTEQSLSLEFPLNENPATLGRMAETGSSLLIVDTRAFEGWPIFPETSWIRSSLAAPICRRGEVVGLISLYSREVGFFNQAHMRRLEAFADQAAVALQNAWLYQSESKQLELARTLQAVGALLTSRLSLDEVLDHILDLLRNVVHYDSASVLLVGDDGRFGLVAARGYANVQQVTEFVQTLIPEVYEQRWGSSDVAVIAEVNANPDWVNWPTHSFGIASWMGAALRVRGRLIGALNLDRYDANAFSKEVADTVLAFANQAAVAIENARLYSESQDQIKRLALLNEITRVGTATLKLDDLLQQLVDSAALIIGGDGAYITFWDPLRRTVTPVAASGSLRETYPHEGPSGPEVRTMTRSVLEARQAIAVEDVFNTPHVDPAVAAHYPTCSLLALPLHADDRDLGALLIGFNQLHRFTQEEIRWAEQAAELVSLAIAKAQAYSRLEERVEQRTEQLRQANQRLLMLTQLKDEFVSNVSHELRTPITSIKLYHHLLKSNRDRFESYMERLDRETERLEFIIEDLLRLSELDQGEMQLNIVPTDLNGLLSLIVTDRQVVVQEKGLNLSLIPDLSLPSVMADLMLIGHAFSILLTNAVNYTPRGGSITVSTQQLPMVGENWAIISVRDTGPGIPEEEQPMLFQRFFRGKVGRESNTEGTGLGLAIAREIVERHSGRIEVISQEGSGATFSIWLPIKDAEPAA